MVIVFCEKCHARIPPAELEAHTAIIVEENKVLCAACAAAANPARKSGAAKPPSGAATVALPAPTSEARQSRTGIRPATRTTGVERPSGSFAPAARAESSASRPAAAPAGPPGPAGGNRKLAIIIGAGGLVFFLVGIFVALRREDTETAADGAVAAKGHDTEPPPGAGRSPNTRVTGAGGSRPPKREPEPGPPPDRKLPSWMMSVDRPKAAPDRAAAVTPPSEPVKATPEPPPPVVAPVAAPAKPKEIVVPAAPGETIWVEDDVPAGATRDGTLKADSWKWVAQPDPVYSGTQAHSMRAWEGQGIKDELRQHFFTGANPPLQVSPSDVLFVHVYLDPKSPPKEIMLQWQFRGGWEHRAYWGEDLINLGQNFSPSRMQSGRLPKAGEWVRLEVRGSEIGVEADDEACTGWSFDQFGGVVYWDRAGVVSKPKTVAAAPANAPPAPTPGPGAAPAVTPAAGAATAGYLPSTLKKWAVDELHGRNVYGGNFGGKKSTAIWAKTTPHNSFWGAFDLALGRYGPGELITTSFQHGSQPCLLSITVNGQEIYNGRDKATQHGKWGEERYPIPSSVLRPGKNEFRINNMEPQGRLDADPWYMLHAAEIVGSLLPDFPPVVAEAQRNAAQAYDRAFEQLARKESDAAARLDLALRQARSVAAPELTPLVDVLEKAQALHGRAVAVLAKTPPTEPVTVEKLKLTGTVARVAGGKAYIKSQGIEMPVDVNLLPQAVFVKALAFDETKAGGIAEKAAWSFATGNVEGAQQLLKRLKKEDTPVWAVLFERRAGLDRLLKFEASVSAAEAALKNSKPADALPVLDTLKKDYADLVAANKERLDYLVTVAEGPKK